MKTIRLIRQNSDILAYLQIGDNIPRRFKIDPKRDSQISVETAQLLFTNTACVDELNRSVVQNAALLSSNPLLLKEYTSKCTLFGETFVFQFPIATKAGSMDIIGGDMLQNFADYRVEDDEITFDNGKSRYTRNEFYTFRQYENTNIIETMSHVFDELRRNDKTIRKPYHSKQLIQMMDMAMENAIFYYSGQNLTETEYIVQKIESMFMEKIDFDCNYCTPFRYSPTGKFLYLRGMTALDRSGKTHKQQLSIAKRNQAFTDLLKASSFFLPESQIAYRICGALKGLVKTITSSNNKILL